jgi:hypothetical protein
MTDFHISYLQGLNFRTVEVEEDIIILYIKVKGNVNGEKNNINIIMSKILHIISCK